MPERNHEILPRNIWLLCATKPEWGPLKNWGKWERLLAQPPVYRLDQEDQTLTLIQLGLGPKRAEESLRSALNNLTLKPDSVIHFGVSGALVPGFKIGDVFWINEIIHEEGEKLALNSSDFSLATADLLTSSRVLSTPQEKEIAGKKFNAQLVDMESYPCAKICQENQISYSAVRSVFDPLETDLTELSQMSSLKESGDLNLTGLASGLIQKPKRFLQLPHWKQASDQATQKCCEALQQILKETGFPPPRE